MKQQQHCRKLLTMQQEKILKNHQSKLQIQISLLYQLLRLLVALGTKIILLYSSQQRTYTKIDRNIIQRLVHKESSISSTKLSNIYTSSISNIPIHSSKLSSKANNIFYLYYKNVNRLNTNKNNTILRMFSYDLMINSILY